MITGQKTKDYKDNHVTTKIHIPSNLWNITKIEHISDINFTVNIATAAIIDVVIINLLWWVIKKLMNSLWCKYRWNTG